MPHRWPTPRFKLLCLSSISIRHCLRAAGSAIPSSLHLGQGKRKPSARGSRGLMGTWCWLLGDVRRAPWHLLPRNRRWSMPLGVGGRRFSLQTQPSGFAAEHEDVTPSTLENACASSPKDGSARPPPRRAVASRPREIGAIVTPVHTSGN